MILYFSHEAPALSLSLSCLKRQERVRWGLCTRVHFLAMRSACLNASNSRLQSKYLSSVPTPDRMDRRCSSSSLPSYQPPHHNTGSPNESSQAIVSRIYEEELTKLAEQAKQSGNMTEHQLYQVLVCHFGYNHAQFRTGYCSGKIAW